MKYYNISMSTDTKQAQETIQNEQVESQQSQNTQAETQGEAKEATVPVPVGVFAEWFKKLSLGGKNKEQEEPQTQEEKSKPKEEPKESKKEVESTSKEPTIDAKTIEEKVSKEYQTQIQELQATHQKQISTIQERISLLTKADLSGQVYDELLAKTSDLKMSDSEFTLQLLAQVQAVPEDKIESFLNEYKNETADYIRGVLNTEIRNRAKPKPSNAGTQALNTIQSPTKTNETPSNSYQLTPEEYLGTNAKPN